jgi:Flp pilus assembly protein TadG
MRRLDRSGAMAPLFAIVLPAMLLAVGLAVDGASVRLEQAQLQVAADAAAAAAVRRVSDSSAAAIEAQRVADLNHPGVLAAGDVATGRWDATAGSFTPGGTANAVQVITRRNKPLIFAGVIGMSEVELAARAIALCPTNPQLSQISTNLPSRISVVTMGQACQPASGLTGTCYWSTPQGNPIIRVDNWASVETRITIRITSPSQFAGTFDFTAPYAGQFWVVVPTISLPPAGQNGTVTNIVFRVQAASPTVPPNRINTGGTATYNNRFNATTSLPGTAICASSNQAAASRLVG